MKDSQAGQTLIEVIIAIGLIILVLTSLISGLVLSVRNSRFARDQALSKEHIRESIEWLRSMRDQLGWDAFASTVRADGAVVRYCLDTLPTTLVAFAAKAHSASCTTPITGTPFVRSVVLTVNGTNTQIDALAQIDWVEGSKTFTSRSTLVLKEWR